jgi:hypothetical protein
MKLFPTIGIDQLLFGMKQHDVELLYGKPDKQFSDEDQNVIYVYNQQKWRLTFYDDEELRLGYIIVSHQEITLFDTKIIGEKVDDIKTALENHRFKSWEKEDFDLAENHFNEENWLILQSEYDLISKVEIGAIINDKDEFNWKFGKK